MNQKLKLVLSIMYRYIVPLMVATIVMVVSIFMLPNLYHETELPKEQIYITVFSTLILFTFILLLLLLLKKTIFLDNWIHSFLELGNERKFTFSNLMAFLGEQALCSFLTTLLLVTNKMVGANYGPLWAGIYSYFMFMIIMVTVACSLMRFILSFNHTKVIPYMISGMISAIITQLFYRAGLLLAHT